MARLLAAVLMLELEVFVQTNLKQM
jgi:hypothetical protein